MKEGRKGLSVFPRTSGWSGALEQAFFSLALEASLVSGWVNRGWEGPQRWTDAVLSTMILLAFTVRQELSLSKVVE